MTAVGDAMFWYPRLRHVTACNPQFLCPGLRMHLAGTHTGQLRLLPPAAPSPQKALSLTPSKPLSTSGSSEEEAGEQLQGPWGRFAVDLTWSEPLSGTGVDVYELVSPNTLHVHSTLHVGGKEVHNTAVFHRKK